MEISAVEARRKFGEMLNRVILKGEVITIKRAGKIVAKLVRPDYGTEEARETTLDFRASRGLGKSIWADIVAEDYIHTERDEWN
jgi:antitoxin (DNA-binding transcriptional repressor) of toxin-antitoxin stability system